MTKNIVWWFLFFCFAIIGQSHFNEIDFLILGFILLLQEENVKQFFCVLPFLFLIHEGTSTFAFGSTLLWYIVIFALMIIGKCLFEVENFLFMFLFSSATAFSHIAVYILMARLQNIQYNLTELSDSSVLQALITPCLWYLLSFTRPKKPGADALKNGV